MAAGEDRFSLRRWSQRKLAASRAATDDRAPAAAPAPVARADGLPVALPAASSAPAMPDAAGAGRAMADALPNVESLTIDSDFTGFLQPGVDDAMRRSALKKLFADPHFNVMDGLDVYIDDYSVSEVLDPAIARTLVQARYIFDPPKTRINEQGHVEDVPPEEEAQPAQPQAESPDALAQPSEPAPPIEHAEDVDDGPAGTTGSPSSVQRET